MKKFVFCIFLFAVSAAYAVTLSPKPVQDTRCDALERTCRASGYQLDEKKIEGKNLYADCILLTVSGFPPTDINTSRLSPADIQGCKDKIQKQAQ